MGFNLLNGIAGAATGLLDREPRSVRRWRPRRRHAKTDQSGAGNIGPHDRSNAPAATVRRPDGRIDQFALNLENMRHNSAMQWQSTMFNELEERKTEQLREMNVMRDVAMKQREADIRSSKSSSARSKTSP